MRRRNRLRNGRYKALFGADGAIMAAATLTAASMNAAATASAASKQAESVEQSARIQADSLEKQNQNANKLQETSLEFTKQQNDANRDLQRDIQMNLQILTGQQNLNEMRDAAKIQVRNGGRARGKLRRMSSSFLQGDNIPGIVTPHKGNYIPIANTDNGILVMLTGPNHENGGVDVDINGNKDIEAEGGELMHVKYGLGGRARNGIRDVQFISKHKLPGTNFNPSQAVLAGVMTPDQAFVVQEEIKDIKGISDSGTTSNSSRPVRRLRPYGGISTINITPDLSLDFLAPVATGVVAGTRDIARNGRSLRCGGRHKAAYGFNLFEPPVGSKEWFEMYGTSNTTSSAPKGTLDWTMNQTPSDSSMFYSGIQPASSTPSASTVDNTPKNSMSIGTANLVGAGINSGANLLGAGINAIGNAVAARRLGNAYTRAGGIMSDAYSKLQGIDLSKIRLSDYTPAHAMAALQAPIVQTGAERAAVERDRNRRLTRINKGTMSSAAAQDRSSRVETESNDSMAQIASRANQIRQSIMQENMRRLTETSAKNAELDAQGRQAYANAYLHGLEYNAGVENQKVLGIGESQSNAILQKESALSNARQANAAGFANALTTGISGLGNSLTTNAKLRNELEMTMLGASDDAVLRYIYANKGSADAKRAARSIWLRYKNSSNENFKQIADDLAKEYNFA